METKAEKNKSRTEAIKTHRKGRNSRPSFHALWHLEDLGVVENLKTFESAIWEQLESAKPAKAPVIVVMDTPLDEAHPNLQGSINTTLMRDFSVFNEGAFPHRISTSEKNPKIKERETILKVGGSSWAHSTQATTIKREITDEVWAGKRSTLTRQVPGAHGTAVSGLIAARPGEVCYSDPVYIGEENVIPTADKLDLPYCGINPFATIIPVTLSAAPYPDMVLGALDYIAALDPDVVVIAAAWADDADRGSNTIKADPGKAVEQNETGHGQSSKNGHVTDAQLWKAVETKLKAISEKSVVLCAAGNLPSDRLAFPASLCGQEGNNIWAVAACNSEGEALSYSPQVDPKKRMLKTLSTQLPRNDREQTVKDIYRFTIPELQQDMDGYAEISARDIITLDPTERQGYNPTTRPKNGPADGVLLEIGSLFTRFSGTSAATAIAAGLISLVVLPDRKMDRTQFDPDALFDLEQAKRLFGR